MARLVVFIAVALLAFGRTAEAGPLDVFASDVSLVHVAGTTPIKEEYVPGEAFFERVVNTAVRFAVAVSLESSGAPS